MDRGDQGSLMGIILSGLGPSGYGMGVMALANGYGEVSLPSSSEAAAQDAAGSGAADEASENY